MAKADGNLALTTMKAHGNSIGLRAKARYTPTHPIMKVMLKMDTNMDEAWKYFPMAIAMMGSMLTASPKEMENIAGKTGQFIEGNLKMGSDMVLGNGHLVAKAMKATISTTKKMVKEYTSGEGEAIIKGNLWTICVMVMEKCIGIRLPFIKDNGEKVFNPDKAKYGRREN